MKQTNYHLFDFMDFDTSLSLNEALYKALKPSAIIENEGDIEITIPFQKQLNRVVLSDASGAAVDYQ